MSEANPRQFIKGIITGVLVMLILGGTFVAGAVTSGGYLFFNGGGNGRAAVTNPAPTPSAQAPTQPEPDAAKIKAVGDGDWIRGDQNARVTLIEYSDYECPYCARFKPTVDKILTEYAGQVRLVYRDFPLSFHPNAQKAAEAAECAGEQGKYWEMHDKLFAMNESKTLSIANYKTAAQELGLNADQFASCLDQSKYAQEITADYQDGIAGGVTGTPGTFVIAADGSQQYIPGALPYEQVKALIDSLI